MAIPRPQAYINVFLLQGLFMWIVALPIMLVMGELGGTISVLSILGLLIWVFGFVFETVSDYQLSRFIADTSNKGKIMRYGLWKYSRHPNYFGEITQWWGIWVFALFAPGWLLVVLGPITITVLILGVSGIPMLEKRYEGNKEYQRYKQTTSAFFPMLPRSSK